MRNICPALDRAKAATALKPRSCLDTTAVNNNAASVIRFLEGDDVFGLRVRPDEDSGDNEHYPWGEDNEARLSRSAESPTRRLLRGHCIAARRCNNVIEANSRVFNRRSQPN